MKSEKGTIYLEDRGQQKHVWVRKAAEGGKQNKMNRGMFMYFTHN